MRASLVDMDGTLCDVQGIRHYVECDRPDFRSFHEASRFCPTRPEVEAEVRRAAAEGLAVIVVTARDASLRACNPGLEPVRAIEDRLDIAEVWSDHGIEVHYVGDERSPGRSAPRGQATPAAASRRTGVDDA